MKIVLLKDIPKVGKKHEIKNVSDGYAKNFLIPQRLAELATPQNIRKTEGKLNEINKEKEKQLEIFRDFAKKIASLKLEFTLKTDKKGSVFGTISENEIAAKLKEKGIETEPEQIQLGQHLKELGEHIVKIKFSPEIEADLKITIKGEGEGIIDKKSKKTKTKKSPKLS